jgi:peptidoglycan/xylan/chitin deacetylase (PgdA/CDA1 family)
MGGGQHDMAIDRPALDKGVFVISIDTELAWSVVHRGAVSSEHLSSDRVAAERGIVGDLLNLFEEHDVKATWATVGHLFLDECHAVEGRKHPEILRPNYEWFDGDWFALDPSTDLSQDPMWYGSDIVQMIRQSQPSQEIGSHSFSHLIVGDPGCSAEAFASDLVACREVATATGVNLLSFVYPRNTIGHLDVLADNGFTSYRGLRPGTFPAMGGLIRRALSLVDKIRPLAGSVVLPQRDGSLWNLPATNLYAPFDRARYVPFRSWVTQQVRRLDQASKHRSLFHLWFHPHNLIEDPQKALQGLERILKRVDDLRRQERIENLTMGELTRRLENESASASQRPTHGADNL